MARKRFGNKVNSRGLVFQKLQATGTGLFNGRRGGKTRCRGSKRLFKPT